MIGHSVIFYRQQEDPEKRKISLPQRDVDTLVRKKAQNTEYNPSKKES